MLVPGKKARKERDSRVFRGFDFQKERDSLVFPFSAVSISANSGTGAHCELWEARPSAEQGTSAKWIEVRRTFHTFNRTIQSIGRFP